MKFNTMKMKKYLVFALTMVLMASLLTVPVFAAGLLEGLETAKTKILQGVSILCIIAAIGLGFWTYATTRSKPKTIGTILFFVFIAGLAGVPTLLTGWGTDMAGWFNG